MRAFRSRDSADSHTSDRRDRKSVRRRRLAVLTPLVALATALVLVAAWRLDDAESASVLVPREEVVEIDVLAYDESEGEEVERRAAFGLSQPLYAKSPGVTATARRTESYRPLVEDAVAGSGFDADLVEAIVFWKAADVRT